MSRVDPEGRLVGTAQSRQSARLARREVTNHPYFHFTLPPPNPIDLPNNPQYSLFAMACTSMLRLLRLLKLLRSRRTSPIGHWTIRQPSLYLLPFFREKTKVKFKNDAPFLMYVEPVWLLVFCGESRRCRRVVSSAIG